MTAVDIDDSFVAAKAALQEGNFPEAEKLARTMLLKDGKSAPALVLLGAIAAKTGHVAQGIQWLRNALEINPELFDAHYWLGIHYRIGGDTVSAIAAAEKAVALDPNEAKARASLASCYSAVQQREKAVEQFRIAIRLDPTIPEIHHNLGLELHRIGLDDDAVESYQTAIRLAPHLPNSQVTLGRLLLDLNRRDDASKCLNRAFLSATDSPESYLQLGRSMLDEGIVDEAERCFRKVLELDPKSPAGFAMLGNALLQLGRFEEAAQYLESAIKIQPRHVRPYIDLINSRRATEADRPLTDSMETMLRDRSLTSEDRRNIQYALGKAHNDLGGYRKAFQHFEEANGMMLQQLSGRSFDREGHSANFDRMIRTFSKQSFASNQSIGNSSEKPIFIVGMIRSGTTLVEQIVSSHPKVTAGGELTFLLRKFQSVLTPPKGSPHAAEAKSLTAGFLELLRSIGGEDNKVTDKMPHNFLLLGMIHTLLPNARIIHCRRHPVDTCISIYSTPFPEPLNFAHSQEGIVFFYKEYQRIMEHWREALPTNRLLEINYEDLVTNREEVSRQMVEFCGLEWNEACLHHEENDAAIRTPSWWQARQPVYRTSIGRWRHYEPWLGPFEELL